jgi:hypothetical protein
MSTWQPRDWPPEPGHRPRIDVLPPERQFVRVTIHRQRSSGPVAWACGGPARGAVHDMEARVRAADNAGRDLGAAALMCAQMKTTIIIVAAILIGLANANAEEKIDNKTNCSVAAKAFDTRDLAAIRVVGDYIANLFAQFSENVGTPGVSKMGVEDRLVAIVVGRCRNDPSRTIETQTRLVFFDWRTKPDFWESELRP